MTIIWHNPRCSKSRQTLALVEEKGDVTIRRYLDDAPGLDEIKQVHALLGGPVIGMMRAKDALFRELGLTKDDDDARLFQAMAEHPALIERPIVLAKGKAAMGRPPEAVLGIL
ncbi:arsenate reductase (glutaredoxin) [Shimia sp.]|uniref:arsenate reductase (glutaredoxin) n=1 Tax=Shimia sp. TaxID=1954381 RepID=UPI003298E733